jgi:hypothetical protein
MWGNTRRWSVRGSERLGRDKWGSTQGNSNYPPKDRGSRRLELCDASRNPSLTDIQLPPPPPNLELRP